MSLICYQQHTRQELIMSDHKLIYRADKIHQRFRPPYVLKLTASQTRIFILLQSTKKDTIICINNVIAATNLSVKLHIKIQPALYLFDFIVLFSNSFGNSSEQPHALQLLIKMLIRCCLKREGCSLL